MERPKRLLDSPQRTVQRITWREVFSDFESADSERGQRGISRLAVRVSMLEIIGGPSGNVG